MDFLILIIVYFSIFSIVVPLTLAALQWSKLPRKWSVVKWIIVASFLGDLIGYVVGVTLGVPDIIGNIYLVIQFTLIFYLLGNYIPNKNVLIPIYVSYIVFYVVDIIFFESFFVFLTSANALAGLVIILLSLFFFYQLINDRIVTDTHRAPIVLIVFSFLLYYCGSFFVFLSDNYLQNQAKHMLVPLWTIHNVCNIIKNILLATALLQHYRYNKSISIS